MIPAARAGQGKLRRQSIATSQGASSPRSNAGTPVRCSDAAGSAGTIVILAWHHFTCLEPDAAPDHQQFT